MERCDPKTLRECRHILGSGSTIVLHTEETFEGCNLVDVTSHATCEMCGDRMVVAPCCEMAATYVLDVEFNNQDEPTIEWFGGSGCLTGMRFCPWCAKPFGLRSV